MPDFEGYAQLVSPQLDDHLLATDVHDQGMSPRGTTKWISLATLLTLAGGSSVVDTISSASGTVALSAATSNVYSITMTGNCTFTLAGATAGIETQIAVYLFQDSTGGRTATWPGSVSWLSGAGAPALPVAAGSLALLIFSTVNGGTTWYGSLVRELPLPLGTVYGGTGNTTGQAVSAVSLAGGAVAVAAKTVTAAYTATTSDNTLLVNPDSGGAFTVTLPAASAVAGQQYCILYTGTSGNIVTIAATAGNVGNTATYQLYAQYQCLGVTSDGTNWQITGLPVTEGTQTFSGNKQFSGFLTLSGGAQVWGFYPVLNQPTSGTYTTGATDALVLANGATTVSLGLPSIPGSAIMIAQMASGSLTVNTTNSKTIDGAASITLTQYQAVIVATDTSNNWHIIASFGFTKNNILDDGAGNATLAGLLKLAAGTATLTPLKFQSGTLNTTAAAGAMEYDGTAFYATAQANSRQVLDAEQMCTLTSAYTLTSQTAAQQLFNATANGALTVEASTTYYFECFFSLSAMSATSGSFGFALGGTATLTSQLWETEGNKATLATAASAQNTVNTAANTAIVTATTGTVGWAKVWGKVRVNAAGTLIPQVSLGVAAAAVVGADSYFRIWPVGSSSVTNVGDWS